MDMRQAVASSGTRARASARDSTTIDLGDLSVPEGEPPADPPSPAVLRAVRAALVVTLVVGACGGAAPGIPHLAAPMWTRQASLAGFVVGATALAMSDPGSRSIVGRDLNSGDSRWRITLADPPQYTYAAGAGVVAVVARNVDVDVANALSESAVTLLVTESGTILARLPGNRTSAVPTASLLLVDTGQASVTVGCPLDSGPCTDVAAFDLITERQVWRRALPGLTVPSVAGAGGPLTRFAMIRPDGLVDVRDPATGDLLTTVELPGGRLGLDSTPHLLLHGDTLMSAVRREDRAELVASAVGPRGRRWSAFLPVSRTVGELTARFYLSGCGRLVCLHADGADALFDPDSGALRGRVTHQVIGEVGAVLLAVPSTERPGTAQSRRMVHLLRATDGQSLAAIADAVVVGWHDSDGRAMLARQGPTGTTFSVIDGHGGGQLLGTVSGTDLTCEASRSVLVCADPAGVLRAWRLPVRSVAVLGWAGSTSRAVHAGPYT